ncbi:MAG TPA: CBS domain-containing protein [Gammaproteobacteria bacterium]|nr:CBS domain-containing protein [Gammaproteobacteria bacterium]
MINREIIRVRDVMKQQIDIVDGMTTVSEALHTMKHVETKCLIVDKRHENDEYGMVLIADIAKQVLAKDRAPDRVNVYEIMSKPVLTVDPKMDIRYCARLFERFGLSRAPVVDHDRLVGIISYTDMVLRGLCKHID